MPGRRQGNDRGGDLEKKREKKFVMGGEQAAVGGGGGEGSRSWKSALKKNLDGPTPKRGKKKRGRQKNLSKERSPAWRGMDERGGKKEKNPSMSLTKQGR